MNVSAHNLSASPAPTILPSSTSVRGVLENAGTAISSPVNVSSSAKEEEIASFPGRRSSPALVETGLVRGIGRGVPSSQPSTSVPLSSGITIPSNGGLGAVPSANDMSKRSTLGADERLGGGGMVQPLVSPLSNRMILPQTAKTNDGTGLADSSSVGEAAVIAGRVFSPSVVPGMQWRPGSSFQNQNESVCHLVLLSTLARFYVVFAYAFKANVNYLLLLETLKHMCPFLDILYQNANYLGHYDIELFFYYPL